MLEKNGHEVLAVMVGSSAKRTLPDFFTQKINTEIIRFQSPNFLPSPKDKRSPLLASILYNVFLLPVYIQSLFKIRQTIIDKKPDVVINFYELLCGMTYGIFNPNTPMVNVAHQYYFLTPEFKYTGKNMLQFKLLNIYSQFTALNSSKILALSFRPSEQGHYRKIVIVPPLLRKEVIHYKANSGDYIHGYLLNSGYADELITWSLHNPEQKLHFFWDKKNVEAELMLTSDLTMHTLSDTLFLKYMAGCKAYATTGGFESVCEAMYLQKPVLMVPTHIEQECNVLDAQRSGVGVSSDEFDLDYLMDFLPKYAKPVEFKFWIRSAEIHFLNELTDIQQHSSAVLIQS